MKARLSSRDRAMLAGEHGPAVQMAMRILERMRPIVGAESFLDISAAHIDSALYQGEATLAYAERLAVLGARVVVPTTLNVSGVDEHGWGVWAVPEDWAEKARRQMVAYQSMGCKPTWTCAPYQESQRPAFGDQIAWGESSAVVFANSVRGRMPRAVVAVTMQKLRAARDELATRQVAAPDMIVLGSPDFYLAEFGALVPLLRGQRRHDAVQFLITASRIVRALATKVGYTDIIEQFGGTITVDTCILTTPMLPGKVKTLMTNSAKYAYYAPGLLGTRIIYGDLKDCVRSAISGRIERDDTLWQA